MKLNKWFLDKKYIEKSELRLVRKIWPDKPPGALMVMDIGQMIEFLGEDWIDVVWKDKYQAQWHICDALWEACKEVLENEIS